MPFKNYMDLVPAECDEKTRSYIRSKLDELNTSLRYLKIQCGICKHDRVMFKENREILAAKLRKRFPNSMVLLRGNVSGSSNACFQQDSFFYWAFGIEKPNLWGAIDVETATSYILYDYKVEGNKLSYSFANPEHLVNKYKIDRAMSFVDMKYEISKLGRNMFLVLSDMDEKRFCEINDKGIVKLLADSRIWMCNTVLTPVFKKCRMVKSLTEQYIMAIAANLNSKGIIFVLRKMKPGSTGYSLAALFFFFITSTARHVSKARPISCLAGDKMFCLNHNRSEFFLKDDLQTGDLCILDMGVTLHNYKTNLIATVPVNGIFTTRQGLVYNIVLEIRSTMLRKLKPGVTFSHLANAARRTMVSRMISNCMLEGTIDDIIETGICDIFNPNGIGHLLGIDFYDCEEKVEAPKGQRTGNIDHLVAKKGMVLALNSELYLNEQVIKKWQETPAGIHLQSQDLPSYFGLAARVQEVVLITSDSPQLLSNLPITIDDIQKTMLEKDRIPFQQFRKIENPSNEFRNVPLPMFHRKITYAPPDMFNLRNSLEEKKWFDLDVALQMIVNRRERKPMRYLNETMEQVYTYPYRIRNLLELDLIPLKSGSRRHSFVPFPKARPMAQAKVKIPKEGYGCPYYQWNENFESCTKILEACLDS